MIIGYARASTYDQEGSIASQRETLANEGAERIYHEQTSAVGDRPELEKAIDASRSGDTLVVTRLDRLARDVRHLHAVADRLNHKGVNLRILNLNIDTSTATGRLMFTMLGAVGEFERDMMRERQREGIERAKREGKYRGRAPHARRRADEVRELRQQGYGPARIARELGIGRTSVYRILKDQEGQGEAA